MLCPWSLLRNVMNKHGQRNTIRIIISNNVIFLLLPDYFCLFKIPWEMVNEITRLSGKKGISTK